MSLLCSVIFVNNKHFITYILIGRASIVITL